MGCQGTFDSDFTYTPKSLTQVPYSFHATNHPIEMVTIVADICAAAGIPTEMIYVRGAALTALVAALEMAGRPCEVIVAANTKQRCEARVRVKRAGDPLQVDALAFALAHAAMLRRLMFAIWETAPKSVLKECGIYPNRGYGAVRETSSGKGDIYLRQLAMPSRSGPAWTWRRRGWWSDCGSRA